MLAERELFYKMMQWPVSLLFAVFFIAAVNIAHVSSAIVLLVFLAGIVLAFNGRVRAGVDQSIYFFAVIAIVYLLIAVISWYMGERSQQGLRELGRYTHYLIILPTAFVLVRFGFQEKLFEMILVMAAWITGTLAVYQIYYVDDILRAQGATGAISFGNYCTILAFCSLVVGWSYLKTRKFYASIAFVGFALGAVGCVLSGSRGAWFAWPVLFLFLIWLLWFLLNTRLKVVFFGVLPTLIVLGLVILPRSYISLQISSVYSNIISYYTDQHIHTSEAARLQMWRTAAAAFGDHPLLGIGLGNYSEYVARRVDAGLAIEAVRDFSHPHNEYLFALATRGIVGLVSLMLLFGYPLYYFLSRIDRRKLSAHNSEIAGIFVVIVFMTASLTEAILARSIMINVYAVLITVLLSFSSVNRASGGGSGFRAQLFN